MSSDFNVYVKTCAMGQTGIHWRHIIDEKNQPVESPKLVREQLMGDDNAHPVIVNGHPAIINDLLDEVKPSVLIYRSNGKILLEVAGIESPERSLRMGRKVLNLIVWEADNNEENEKIIRKIAYSAIQDIFQLDASLSKQSDSSFSNMIKDSIDFYEREEFRVDLQKVNKYVDGLKDIASEQNFDLENHSENSIKIKSDQELKQLAQDIKNRSFPKQWKGWNSETKSDGVLVVITESLEQRDIFYQAGVWRGLASNVEKPQELVVQPIKPILEPEISIDDEKKKATTILQTPQSKKSRLILLITLTIILSIIIMIGIQTLKTKKMKPLPQKTSVFQESLQESWHPPLIL